MFILLKVKIPIWIILSQELIYLFTKLVILQMVIIILKNENFKSSRKSIARKLMRKLLVLIMHLVILILIDFKLTSM